MTVIPISFRLNNVDVTLWPKGLAGNSCIVEVWALAAKGTPDTAEVASLLVNANGSFSYGRLIRQQDHIWYRDIIHADPLGGEALNFSINIAQSTARGFGAQLARLGAVDATLPQAVPVTPETPPDEGYPGGDERYTGMYL